MLHAGLGYEVHTKIKYYQNLIFIVHINIVNQPPTIRESAKFYTTQCLSFLAESPVSGTLRFNDRIPHSSSDRQATVNAREKKLNLKQEI